MTLHRIEHAVVMDTDDIPGRGGYAVVGMSPRVSPAERAFIAGNFGISDYLHDPRTENRIFYSVFRIPGGRRAFVRRFARGSELRRNNTQRRLIVHTLLLDETTWDELYALPWLLLNASLRVEGTDTLYRLSAAAPAVDDNAALPSLEWDSDDGAVSRVSQKVTSRLTVIGNQLAGRAPEPRDLLARAITALAQRSRVVLPQDAGYEWVTMLAWSMLPRHDRDELAWTQHDAMNLSGVSFPLANAVAHDFDPMQVSPAPFAEELVRLNTESEDSWLDLHERTSRDPLTVLKPDELEAWVRWRNELMRLGANIHASESDVVAHMSNLAATVQANPRASWIDREEVLRLIWSNVPVAIAKGEKAEVAVRTWGRRLVSSGLAEVIFRAAPTRRWLTRAAEDVGADVLVWFFLSGGGEDEESKPTRAAIAEWLTGANVRDVNSGRLVRLAYLIARDRSPSLEPLLELLLETDKGLDALHKYLVERGSGGADLIHAAVPIVLRRAHPNTIAFLRDVFVPRFDASRVDAALAREVALILRDDPAAFVRFLGRCQPDVAAELLKLVRQWVSRDAAASMPLARDVLAHVSREEGSLEAAGPLALALAQAGEPARVWIDVLLRMARLTDAQSDSGAARDFREMLAVLRERPLDLSGAMERLVVTLESENVRVHDSLRALIVLLRPMWGEGGRGFPGALATLIENGRLVTQWEELVVAYGADHHERRPHDVSDLAAAFWMKVDPAQLAQFGPRTVGLLDLIQGPHLKRLTSYWSKRVRNLPRGNPAADRLLRLVQAKGVSYEVEMDLALRDIEQGVATPRTLNRLEAAMAKLHKSKASRLFADEVEKYLGDGGPAPRMARLLEVFASTEIHPTVRLALQTHVLARALKEMKGRHWDELRTAVRDEELLAHGVVARLAYAVGARASRRTAEEFERTWSAHGRRDALDALEAGRTMRGLRQWLAPAPAKTSVLAR